MIEVEISLDFQTQKWNLSMKTAREPESNLNVKTRLNSHFVTNFGFSLRCSRVENQVNGFLRPLIHVKEYEVQS